MFAAEFQSTVKDGTIAIPDSVGNHFQGPVRVILLTDEEEKPFSDKIAQLLSQPLTVPDFAPLSRESAHERG